jgi:hypothetical protein
MNRCENTYTTTKLVPNPPKIPPKMAQLDFGGM